ncbi:MAG: hypothetical protein JXA62_06840 [Candidatus Aminicenantes bacterium]|nr:hypothetical protein [Candidatus Aminicenantes bacterium]
MRKIILVGLMATGLLMSFPVRAEDTIGCSKGIGKGVLWPRIYFKMIDYTKKWSSVAEEMVAMDSDNRGLQEASVHQLDFRLGYGVLHNLNVGVNLQYAWGEAEKILPQGDRLELNASDLNQVWLSGQWFFLDKHKAGGLRHLKLGLGASYGFAVNAADENLLAGIGPGVDQFKLGPMWHFEVGSSGVEIAGHALYNWKGTAREVKGWGRSGHNIADTLNYQLKLEGAPFRFLGCGAGLTGWFGMEEDMSLVNLDNTLNRGYNHAVMLHAEFFPMGDQYEKRKIYMIVNIPYAQRAMKSADVVWTLGFMWTFYTL